MKEKLQLFSEVKWRSMEELRLSHIDVIIHA